MNQYCVRDTVTGIPTDKQELLFERFNRPNSTYAKRCPGSGLIPGNRPVTRAEDKKIIRDALNRKILIVEDDEASKMVVKTFLNKHNFETVTAENGMVALELMKKLAFDMVLMDVQMPVLDGISTTKMIRDCEMVTGKHTPIIAITAYALTGDREKFLDAGMDDYISKPFDLNLLKKIIDYYI